MSPVVLPGHRGELERLVFVDDRTLLSASRDKEARVWDASEEKARLVLGGHLGRVHDIARLATGVLVTVSHDCGVRLFDGATGSLVRLLKGHTSAVTAIALAPSGRQFATASDDGSVRLFDEQGNAGAVLKGHALGAVHVAFENEERLVTVSRAKAQRIWNARTGQLLETRPFSPKNARVLCEGDDVLVDGQRLTGLGEGATAVGLLDDEHVYAAYENGELCVVRLGDRTITRLEGQDDVIAVVAVSPNHELVATGCADGTIHVWKWREAIRTTRPVASVACAIRRIWTSRLKGVPDTRFSGDAVWVGRAGTLYELDARTGLKRRAIHGRGDLAVFGATTLVFAHYNKEAAFVDRSSGKTVGIVPLDGNYLRPNLARKGKPIPWVTNPENAPRFARLIDCESRKVVASLGPMENATDTFVSSPDGGRLLVFAKGPSAWLWDVNKEKLATILAWKGGGAHAAGFTHDGARIVVGTVDGRAYVFDARSGILLFELTPPRGTAPFNGWVPVLASGASDRVVIGGEDNRHALLFDASTGAFVAKLFAEKKSGWVSSGVSFSPNGKTLVAALCHEPVLAFFDATTGEQRATHAVHRDGGTPLTMRFFSGGERVLTWGTGVRDRSLRAWDVSTGAPLWRSLGIGGKQIQYLATSPDERFAAVTSLDWSKVRVVDLESGKTIADLPEHPVYAREPSFSEDSSLLATSSNDGVLQMWEICCDPLAN